MSGTTEADRPSDAAMAAADTLVMKYPSDISPRSYGLLRKEIALAIDAALASRGAVNAELVAALEKIMQAQVLRSTTGHFHECAWCNGSANIARAALATSEAQPEGEPGAGGGITKQAVQNFQWDGSTPRMDGAMVWFRSIDGSEHGWPQLTDHEAMRLVLFLHGSKQRSTPPPVAGDEAYKREAMAWRRYMQHARDHELIVFRVRSQHASESECAVFQTFTALELKLYEAQDAVDAAASSAKSAAGRGEEGPPR